MRTGSDVDYEGHYVSECCHCEGKRPVNTVWCP
jgi:hypothetical protein